MGTPPGTFSAASPLVLETIKRSAEGAHGGIAEWLNLEAIKLFTQHTSAVIAAIALFWLAGWIVRKLVHDGIIKRAVLVIDEVVLLCVFVYFAYEIVFVLFIRVLHTHGLWPS